MREGDQGRETIFLFSLFLIGCERGNVFGGRVSDEEGRGSAGSD